MLKGKLDYSKRIISLYKTAVSKKDFYDIYALKAILSSAEDIDLAQDKLSEFKSRLKTLILDAATLYVDKLSTVLAAQALILINFDRDALSEENKRIFDKCNIPLKASMSERKKHTPKQFEIIFVFPKWPNDFDGKFWGSIARIYGKLLDGISNANIDTILEAIERIHDNEFILSAGYDGDNTLISLRTAIIDKSIPSHLAAIKRKISKDLKPYVDMLVESNQELTPEKYDEQVGKVEYEKYIKQLNHKSYATFRDVEQITKIMKYLLSLGKNKLFDFVTEYLYNNASEDKWACIRDLKDLYLKEEYIDYINNTRSIPDSIKKEILKLVEA